MNTRAFFLAAALLPCGPAIAQQTGGTWMPAGAFIADGGVTVHGTYGVSAGVFWPWSWRSQDGRWSGATEAWVSHWSARERVGGRESFTQLALVPVLRWRGGGGNGDWFTEVGIGVSATDRLYRTDRKAFSTRFNFVDTLGVGRSFGDRREHELSTRFVHVSNAGIREPNPGENFIQLRYARRF